MKLSTGALFLSGMAGFTGCVESRRPGNLTTLIDCNLCDGCVDLDAPLCVAACRQRAIERIPDPVEPIPQPFPRGEIEDWSNRKDVLDRLTPYTHLYIQRVDIIDGDGGERTIYVPRRCMHCDNPPCATICPFTANHKHSNGAVVINSDMCFGGAKCRDVCPWEIPQRQSGIGIYLDLVPTLAGNGVMFKCDLCYDRVRDDRLPLCVEACHRFAMVFGQKRDIEMEAIRRAAQVGGYLYGMRENGGTGTIYLSPVSFDKVNDAIDSGPGRPHMAQVERHLEKASVLESSVLLSPVIGMGAGLAAAALVAVKGRGGDGGGD